MALSLAKPGLTDGQVDGGFHFLTGPAGHPGRSLARSPPRGLHLHRVRTAALPPDDLPPLSRSVAACLAAILEIETDEVPAPPAGHPEPWTAWRVWLATRGLGLVPIAEPREFAWPGPWIAILRGDRAAVA